MDAPYPGPAAPNMASPSEETTTNDAIGKLEGEATPIDPAETWSASAPDIPKRSVSPLLSVHAAPVGNTAAETQSSVALKVATTLLQPICLGESPVVLPILAGPATPHVGQTGAASYLMTSQGPVSIPLVLEHLSPQLLQQAALPLQNTLLCQNPSLAIGSPPALDQKGLSPVLDAGLLALLQNPSFAAVIQDIFPGPGSSPPTCHASPSPLIDLSPPFLPPFSPPNHLVPPPTLLVPYPVVIPLPVPLPIPVPIPVPACKAESHSPKQICSKSTQTCTSDAPPHANEPTRLPLDGEVLDLSIRSPPPVHTLPPTPQDNVLDLSVPGVRKPCTGTSVDRQRVCRLGDDVTPRPADRTPKLDTKLLSGLASLEFSRRHKWVVDSGHSSAVGGSVRDSALAGSGNIEIVSTSQTAKVIVSVKDAMPAIFRSKLKGLSGVSTKNFSIRRDGAQGGFPPLPRVPADQHGEADDSPKKVSKSRGIKVKKVSSQEIHILPIKKQRLAAFLPRK